MHLEILSAKWWPFYLGLNVLTLRTDVRFVKISVILNDQIWPQTVLQNLKTREGL